MTEILRLNQQINEISITLIATPARDSQIHLTLDLKMTQGELPLSEGKVKYGLTGGTLKLTLQDAYFTDFSEEINHSLPITKFPTADHPIWKFALAGGSGIIEVDLAGIPLGTITTASENWSLGATLTIGKSELFITETEGLWRHDLRPNKQAILYRKVALFLLETYFPSPLISLPSNESTVEIASPTEAEISSLFTLIEQIQESPSNEFFELCEIAGLNPKLDFAGANLRGTTLRGLDLSGVNWSRVNLRGADLTDVDFSQGNLQGAKLSGADLSGAYLSNANLKETDFHRASLALANLSGANLQAANLQEANISQTNFSGCHLDGAIFDN